MPFMVIYRTSDGSSVYEQADAIDEAALFVERLRNKEGIDQIRIYRMEEISFAFRPYYKVELGLPDRGQAERRFEAALELDPTNDRAARALADLRRQATQERKGFLSRLLGKPDGKPDGKLDGKER